MSPSVTVETVNHVSVIRLDNPRANVLSIAILVELREILDGLSANLPGAVVITTVGRTFSAGADVRELSTSTGPSEVANAFASTLESLATFPRATIAAVDGVALGGGCELALACDFRFAATEAFFGQPEILLGIIPGGGGTQRLARLIGSARAKDLIFTGRHVAAEEALAIGLVDRVFERDNVVSAAIAFATELASGAVVAQGLAKRAIDGGLNGSLGDGLSLERQLFAQVFSTADAALGIRSFLERDFGKVTFTGS